MARYFTDVWRMLFEAEDWGTALEAYGNLPEMGDSTAIDQLFIEILEARDAQGLPTVEAP